MSIQKITRKDGPRYRVKVRINGKQVTKSFRRRVDAEHWEREQLRHRDRPDLKPNVWDEWTVDDLFERTLAEKQVAESTKRAYRTRYANQIGPAFGHVLVTDLEPDHLFVWLKEMEQLGLADNTRRQALALLSSMYKWITKRHGLMHNPCLTVALPKKQKLPFDFWQTKEEVQRFVAACDADEKGLLCLVAIHTGMRIGELCGLNWDCVDLDRSQIVVRRTAIDATNEIQDRTKSRKARVVPLPAWLCARLAEAKLSQAGKPGDPVFLAKRGGRVIACVIRQKLFPRICQAAGLRRIKFHDLRHTFASHFLMGGGDIYVLQRVLGHSSVTMTERYAHLSDEYLAEARDVVSFEPVKAEIVPLFKKGGN